MIGIGAFVLFLALTQRAGTVLEKVFPVDEVQVVAPRVSLLVSVPSKQLDDNTVKTILSRPEVKNAIPRLNLAFPAAGRGNFERSDLKFEVGGFADGVDPDFVQDDERIRTYFKDWDSVPDDKNRVACVPPPRDPREDVIQSPPARPAPENKKPRSSGWGDEAAPAAGGATSGSAAPAASGATSASAAPAAGSAAPAVGSAAPADGPTPTGARDEYFNPCPEPERYYCDDTER
ncbi:MAG TPA: hypothetical protein VK932_06785, partial [Kofleriaceae bacterium]|nr:hypothetical protein [Kofleriaceae bacterium]